MAQTTLPDPQSYNKEQLLAAESQHIANCRQYTSAERKHLYSGDDASQPYCGLALSGGGIRAASFHLGVLQGLARQDLLPWIDYLSAVSGGSFIAGWLTKWLHDSKYHSVLTALSTASADGEPEKVHQLRQNTGYLTPRLGPLGQDTVLFLATYVHQFFIYLLMLTIFGMLILLYPNAALVLSRKLREYHLSDFALGTAGVLVASWGSALIFQFYIRSRVKTLSSSEWKSRAVGLGLVAGAILLALAETYDPRVVPPYSILAVLGGIAIAWGTDRVWRLEPSTPPLVRQRTCAILGLVAANLLVVHLFWYATRHDELTHNPSLHKFLEQSYVPWFYSSLSHRLVLVLIALLVVTLPLLFSQRLLERVKWIKRGEFSRIAKYLLVAVLLWVLIQYLAYRSTDILVRLRDFALRYPGQAQPDVIASLPLVFLMVLPAGIVGGALTFQFAVGILGRLLSPHVRESTMRTITFLYRYTAAWILLCVLAFLGPIYMGPTMANMRNAGTALIVISAATILYRIMATSVRLHRYVAGLSYAFGYCCLLLFASGLTCVLSFGVLGIKRPATVNLAAVELFWQELANQPAVPLLLTMGIFTGLAVFLSMRFGINSSSMHLFYQARVMRAFLDESLPGAERLSSTRARPGTLFSDLLCAEENPSYVGPYLLINSALNLVKSDDTAWQERLATNFVFSPTACGYTLPGLTPNEAHAYVASSSLTYAGETGLRLGHAMAISSSAISSNMGIYTSTVGRFLHTIFNLRLGWWFPNPRTPRSFRGSIPRSRIRLMWDELMGKTSYKGAYVHLSDGGHFENLGLYELVRRGCKVIFVSDASTDRDLEFRALGNAIERCRVDLGVEIHLSLMETQGATTFGDGFQVGNVVYPDGELGILFYIKPILVPGAPLDAHAYALRNTDFPHHPIRDQWFGESQFESYRVLGCTITESVCRLIRQAGHTGLYDRSLRINTPTMRAGPGVSASV
jgi:hypothetical protein